MAFLEIRFPENISKGSEGGPGYLTEVVEPINGYDETNSLWEYSRSSYDAAMAIKTMILLELLLAFFHVVKGRANRFRYKDWSDYKSCSVTATPADDDQTIGTGDSTDGSNGTAVWQLIKTYTVGAYSQTRLIKKPVDGTLVLAVSEVRFTVGTHYTIDYTTGLVTFLPGYVPQIGEPITAGYEFDVPARLLTDTLSNRLESYRIGSLSVPIIETKE